MGPAVLAKPQWTRPPEHMILTRRADMEKRRVYEAMAVDTARVHDRASKYFQQSHVFGIFGSFVLSRCFVEGMVRSAAARQCHSRHLPFIWERSHVAPLTE
jgi:hypothetical protein